MVHHDIWDYDMPMAPNLLDVTVNGRARKIIAATTKQGWVYALDRVTGEPIWPMPETPVGQSEVPGEQTSATQPIPSRPAPYAQQGLVEADLIDYTPAIKDSALKLAQKCRMGPYFIPGSPADGKGANGPAKYKCSWYAPGASGGVNIDGGTAADPETGHDLRRRTERLEHDRSAEGSVLGASLQPAEEQLRQARRAQAAAGLQGGTTVADGFGARSPTTIGAVSILKPRELGGITAYDMNTGDKKWWVPNGNRWREQTTNDPLFAGVTLPKVPAIGGQPEVITTKTLVIHGTGRSGGAGGGRGGRGGRGGGGRGGAAAPVVQPQIYAFDKRRASRSAP